MCVCMYGIMAFLCFSIRLYGDSVISSHVFRLLSFRVLKGYFEVS